MLRSERNKQKNPGGQGQKISGSSGNPRHHEDETTSVNIPNPLPIEVQLTAGDKKRYIDEHDSRDRQTQLASNLNWITGIAAGATIIGVVASVLFGVFNIHWSRLALESDQRAWVVFDEIQLDDPPLKPGVWNPIHIRFKNTGKSPALDVQFRGLPPQTTGKGCPTSAYSQMPYESSAPLGPGEMSTNQNYRFNPDDTCFTALVEGLATSSIQGTVTYRDIFGKQHKTTFCSQFEGTSKILTACPNGNEAD